MLYRHETGLHWSDLTGEWPQPAWRTQLDFWYGGIAAQVAPKKKQE